MDESDTTPMSLDAWLPVGHTLPDGSKTGRRLHGGVGWQIIETRGGGHALLAEGELASRWIETGLLAETVLSRFAFGDRRLHVLTSPRGQSLCPVADSRSPSTATEALSFALALKATRDVDNTSPLQDAIYVERFSRLLPTHSISSRTDDETVLGYWLTGGANVSAASFRRLSHMLSWMNVGQVKLVVESAGFKVAGVVPGTVASRPNTRQREEAVTEAAAPDVHDKHLFELPGRPELEAFFNEHVVDIVQHRDRYKALGIDFPSAIVLHGPPGTGKTFAVDRLVDFLGWPSFAIDASSVASPYIHETSRKVAAVFDKAMESSPAVLVIDEMEAFLADRDRGEGHHRIEEVAEFLRRIPEAIKNDVLIVAMTNRVEMVDPAILRRGRFDHVIMVDYASEAEILSLLEKLLSALPRQDDVDAKPLARALAGRPLSDVTFVVREGARLAARAGKDRLDQASLIAALESAPARDREGGEKRRIGFI